MNWRKDIALVDKYCIMLVPKARDDILNISDYITFTLLEPDISRNFINGLRTAISNLEFFPYKFPLTDDKFLISYNIRCMPYRNYFVFYTIIEEQKLVSILRIGYNKRNWRNILKT